MLPLCLSMVLVANGGQSSIEVFDQQDWEAHHLTTLHVASSSPSSSLTFSHPLPMQTPWSVLPDQVEDPERGWHQSSCQPNDAVLGIYAREVSEYTYDVETLTKGYAYRWTRNGTLPQTLTFESRFTLRTSGRRLSRRFRFDPADKVPESLKKQCEEIAAKAPASLIETAKGIAARSRDEVDVIRKFSNWISQSIRYGTGRVGPYELSKIWELKTGSCRRRSTVFRAMCSVIGIPSREARGYIIKEGETKDARNVGCHGWAEVYLRGAGWIEIEPATDGDAFEIPPSYVRNGYWENAWVESRGVTLNRVGQDIMDDRLTWRRLR